MAGGHCFLFTCLSASPPCVSALRVITGVLGFELGSSCLPSKHFPSEALRNPVLYLPASLHTQRLKVNLQSKTRELDTALECVCCTWDSLTALLCQLGKVSLFAEMSSPKIPVGCKRKTYVSPTVQISIHETPKPSSDPYQLLHTFW